VRFRWGVRSLISTERSVERVCVRVAYPLPYIYIEPMVGFVFRSVVEGYCARVFVWRVFG